MKTADLKNLATEEIRKYSSLPIIWRCDPIPSNHLYKISLLYCNYYETQNYVSAFLVPPKKGTYLYNNAEKVLNKKGNLSHENTI